MNNLIPIDSAIRFGEIIPPSATVRVIGTTHPLNALSGSRIDRHLEVGFTIRQMLEEALDDRADMLRRCSFAVAVDGNPIEECNWHRVRPKTGTTVTFIPRLQGGNTLRTVLGVAVAIAAIVLSLPTGGLSLGLAGVLGVSATTASALIAGGIVPAGPVALDALFQRACETSPTSPKLLAQQA